MQLRHTIVQFFKKSVALLLAILVLTSSAGVPLYTQTCLMEGEETLTLFQAHTPDCCKDSTPQLTTPCNQHIDKASQHLASKPKKCCDLSVDLLKADIQSQVLGNTDFNTLAGIVLIPQIYNYLNRLPLTYTPARYFYTDSSPPISGKTLIIHKQSFLL